MMHVEAAGLTDAGKKCGGEDNITVVIVKIAGDNAHLHPLKRFAMKLLKQVKNISVFMHKLFLLGYKDFEQRFQKQLLVL